MVAILRSLVITITVAASSGALFWSLGYNWIKVSVFTLVGQFVIFYFFNTVLQSRMTLRNKELENARIKEFSKQGTIVPCAYCGEDNFIPIRFDKDNQFPCNGCSKPNSVYINITTAQVTSPLIANPLHAQAYIADREEAIAKLRTSDESAQPDE